jgi:hypothetical protein
VNLSVLVFACALVFGEDGDASATQNLSARLGDLLTHARPPDWPACQ